VAQNTDWVTISFYVKSSDTNGDGSPDIHDSLFRWYDRTNSEFIIPLDWTWTTNPEVITINTSTSPTVDTLPNARGSYYVGNGWHRIWATYDLATKLKKTINYSVQITPVETGTTIGVGAYFWGIMTEYTNSAPTTLCDYIPIRPIVTTIPYLPRYKGTENCVSLTP
jgi:hypothetical protein